MTYSGGEPLLQVPFVAEVIELLDRTHVVLDTSGYGRDGDFRLLLGIVDLVLFDLKVMDPAEHRRHTGRDNGPILRNLKTPAAFPPPWLGRKVRLLCRSTADRLTPSRRHGCVQYLDNAPSGDILK